MRIRVGVRVGVGVRAGVRARGGVGIRAGVRPNPNLLAALAKRATVITHDGRLAWIWVGVRVRVRVRVSVVELGWRLGCEG